MKLHEHQRGVVEWILSNDRCAIWAPMGSGKTAATLCALSIIRVTDPGPVLVLAPKRVAVHTWPSEAEKWDEFKLTVVPVTGTQRERERALQATADIYSCSYDNLPWLVEHFGDRWPFTTVVADESTRLKSFRTRQGGKRARALGSKLEDLGMLYKMYAETSVRDGFVIRDEGYYKTVWTLFMNSAEPTCEPLIAEVDGEPVAAIFVFYFAGRAYYVNGMSRDEHREKMPAYLLQCEAMKRARAKGCIVYDLWGAPEVFDESDTMWGVFRFKEGFGGKVVRTLGAWDFAPSPLWYKMYSEIIPRVLDVMRSRGKTKTKQSLGGV